MFTEVINQEKLFSRRLIHNLTSFCSRPLMAIKKNESLRHFRIGFTDDAMRMMVNESKTVIVLSFYTGVDETIN